MSTFVPLLSIWSEQYKVTIVNSFNGILGQLLAHLSWSYLCVFPQPGQGQTPPAARGPVHCRALLHDATPDCSEPGAQRAYSGVRAGSSARVMCGNET